MKLPCLLLIDIRLCRIRDDDNGLPSSGNRRKALGSKRNTPGLNTYEISAVIGENIKVLNSPFRVFLDLAFSTLIGETVKGRRFVTLAISSSNVTNLKKELSCRHNFDKGRGRGHFLQEQRGSTDIFIVFISL